MCNIPSPSSFALSIEGRAVRNAPVFSLLSPLFQTAAQAAVVYAHGTFPFRWHKLIYTACPPATGLIQHKGTGIYFASPCRAEYTETYNLELSSLAICCVPG